MTPLSLCLSLSLVLSATIASAGLGTPSDVPVPPQTPGQSEDQFPSFSPNSPQSADLLSTSPSVSASEVSQASGILRSSPLIPLESHLEPTLSAESPAQATRGIADDPEALAAFQNKQEHHRKLSNRSKPGKSVMPAVTPDYILQQLKRLYLLASLNDSVDSGYSTYEAATQRVEVVKRPIRAAQMIKELQLPDSWEELLASAQRAGNASVQTPTPLTKVENTYSYPWSATVQLFATYPNQLGLCSGALIAKHHVLTAGHCVYSHDDKEWATHIEVDASSTDVLYPLHNSFDDTTAFYNRHLLDRPNGASYATYMRTYNGWINNGDLAYDMAVITIDRDMGSLAGGFGMASGGVFPGSLLTWGYPASDDYLGVWQYNRGADGVESTLPNGFNDAELDAEIHHGDSGGPMWFYQKSPALYEIRAVTSYTLAGVHTPAFGNIIVPSRMSDIQGWISSDPAPAAKSQIIQFVNVPTAAVFPGTVAVTAPAGGNVGIQFFLANRAFVDCTQVIAIRYAFSTTTLLSGASKDTVSVTVTTVSALAANHYVAIPSTSGLVEVAIPSTLPSGLFYVLAYWDATCTVYDSNYSFAVLGAVTVQGKSA